jgi:hypothetical protein
MLEDSVLRCLVHVQIAGITIPDVFDAVLDGDEYLIVTEWGSHRDATEAHLTPKEFFKVPACAIAVAPEGCKDYELLCTTVIDWAGLNPTDIPTPIPRSFLLPPDD